MIQSFNDPPPKQIVPGSVHIDLDKNMTGKHPPITSEGGEVCGVFFGVS